MSSGARRELAAEIGRYVRTEAAKSEWSKALGVELRVVHGFIEARCNALCGARVVLEFPSVAQAKAWVNSPEYAPARRVRQQASRSNIVVVEGVVPA